MSFADSPLSSTPDYWWRDPAVWAGAALGGTAATASFSPSLMPRSTTHQAVLAGVAGVTGWSIGSASYALIARTGNAGIDTVILGAGAAVGISVRYLMPWHEHEPPWRPPIRSLAQVAGAGAASAASITAIRDSRSRSAVAVAAAAASGIVAATRIRSGISKQAKAREEVDFPAPNPTRAILEGIGVLGALGALVGGYRRSGGALARVLESRAAVPPRAARHAGNVLSAGIWALGARAAAGSVITGLKRYDRMLDPGYDTPPALPERSGSGGSAIPWSRLGRQGRRFITDTPTVEDIEAVMGVGAAATPIRVFVGFDSARTAEDRVELAMRELHRTAAFDRELLIVSCPAGTGYVNTLPMEVADFAAHGDTASVAVQYARLPSLLALQNTKSGAKHHRLLLEAVRAELALRSPSNRPCVVVYGESLGAWAGQDAFIDGGIRGLDDLGVDRALWVGTPYYSKWRRQMLDDDGSPEGSVVEINGPEDTEEPGPRVTLLTHHNDPVNRANASLFYREPHWLMERPPQAGISGDQTWVPLVTAFQTVVDTMNATHPTPGVFRATGHDYRLDLPKVTVSAYGLDEPSDNQWTRMLEHLQAEEKRRHEAMSLSENPL